jgi:hypothetical protein
LKEVIDLLKNIFDSTKIRIKNPVVGNFVISWALINWKAILFFLFSKGCIEYKLNYFDKNYSCPFFTILLPLIFVSFYIFCFPKLLSFIEIKTKDINTERKKFANEDKKENIDFQIELAIKQSELLDRKSNINSQNDILLMKENFEKQIQIRDETIENLNKEKAKLEMENLKSKNSTTTNNFVPSNDLDIEFEKLFLEEYNKLRKTLILILKKDGHLNPDIDDVENKDAKTLLEMCEFYKFNYPKGINYLRFYSMIPTSNSEAYKKEIYKTTLQKEINSLNLFIKEQNIQL